VANLRSDEQRKRVRTARFILELRHVDITSVFDKISSEFQPYWKSDSPP
jgi:hypothetical protein